MVTTILTHSVTAVFLPQLTVRFYNNRCGNIDSSSSSQVQTLENLYHKVSWCTLGAATTLTTGINKSQVSESPGWLNFFTVAPNICSIIIAVFPIHMKTCISSHAPNKNHSKDQGSLQICGSSVWTCIKSPSWYQECGSDNQIFR